MVHEIVNGFESFMQLFSRKKKLTIKKIRFGFLFNRKFFSKTANPFRK